MTRGHHSDGSLGYRPEIDGVRAIAVTSVVLYHAGVPGLPGGFVGVDVFFVISGFLITFLLLKEQGATGTIDLIQFYARRARRLFPALFTVLFFATLAGAFILLPLREELTIYMRSLRNTVLYVSNFYFASITGGYFDGPSDQYPLLHTWSLAVEEQFYVVWPPLLLLAGYWARRTGRRFLGVVLRALVAIALVSFAVNIYGAGHEGWLGQAAFYLLPSRAWELAVGGLLACLFADGYQLPRPVANLASGLGLAGIAISVTLITASMPFPGWVALFPVLATAALIAGLLAAPGGLAARVLSTAPFVKIGQLSYGWYLWHWPFLAYARVMSLGERNLPRDLALAFASLGAAWVTYTLIEHPIRSRRVARSWNKWQVLAGTAVCSGALFASAFVLQVRGDRMLQDPRNANARYFAAAAEDPRAQRCTKARKPDDPTRPAACNQGHERPGQLVLWGDSHAYHIAHAVAAEAALRDIGFQQKTRGGCPPLLQVVPMENAKALADCRDFNDRMFGEISTLAASRRVGVILLSRWGVWQDRQTISELDRERTHKLMRSDGTVAGDTLDATEAALRRTIGKLTELGVRVLVIGPVPEQRYRAPWCLARRGPEHCAASRAEEDNYRRRVVTALREVVANQPGVRFVDPIDAFCDANTCPTEVDGTVLYSDDDHLSLAGAERLLPLLEVNLAWLVDAPSAAR